MTTLLYHHPVCAEHDTGPGHPECAARLEAVLGALKTEDFAELKWREAPIANSQQIMRIHPENYMQHIMAAIPEQGLAALDGDTIVSPNSGEAALRAVGAVCAAVDAVVTGEANNAFCAIRPPGHHAEPVTAMGFCLFNSVAIGAAHARAAHGLQRAAVIDFDVHHGNGTQAAFEAQGDYLYISSHQSPLYPGTGRRSERGVGNIVNIPLAPNSGSTELHQAWEADMEPALRAFKPDIILISAGFDAHTMDPLASLNFSDEDYDWITHKILSVAAEYCEGRVVSSLEGGYNLSALASSAAIHVKALLKA